MPGFVDATTSLLINAEKSAIEFINARLFKIND